MAGARTVEEILERGGGDSFAITMFGDEPYGNYNRILLSNVLAGRRGRVGDLPQRLAWYADNGITLHAGVPGRPHRPATPNRCTPTTAPHAVRQADHRHRQPRRSCRRSPGMRTAGPRLTTRASSRSATLDDTRAMIRYARDHERAVVIGGGLLGLEAARGLQNHGVDVTLVHAAGHLMNQQLDAAGRARSCGAAWRRSASRSHRRRRTTEILGKDAVTGVAARRRPDASTCDMVVVAAGIRAERRAGGDQRARPVERGIVVDDQMRALDDAGRLRGRRVRPAPRPGLRAGRAAVGAGQGARRPRSPAANPRRGVPRLPDRDEAQGGRASTSPSMGITAPERDDDEFVVFAEPRRGRLQERHHPRRPARRRHPARRRRARSRS